MSARLDHHLVLLPPASICCQLCLLLLMSPHSFSRALMSLQLHCSLITWHHSTAHFPKAFLCSPSLDYRDTTKTRKSQANNSRRETQHKLYSPSISLFHTDSHSKNFRCPLLLLQAVLRLQCCRDFCFCFSSLKSLLSRPPACKENPDSFTSKKQMAINLFLNTVGIQLFPRNLLKSK